MRRNHVTHAVAGEERDFGAPYTTQPHGRRWRAVGRFNRPRRRGRQPGKAWAPLTAALDDGFDGLYVTRQHPNHVDKRHGPKTLKVVWLSTTLGRDYVDPHNLGALTNLINAFTDTPRQTAILLDGLEYLMINNDYARVLKFVEYLREIVMQRKCVLLVSVDDRAFDP